MSKKLADLSQINEELSGALHLLQERLGDFPVKDSTQGNVIQGTASLLQRCADIVDNKQSEKPLVRVLHHFACSGGTLISKCLAAMPNVFLLSEAHPLSMQHMVHKHSQYRPTDIISLARYANVPNVNSLAKKIFAEDIKISIEHINAAGGELVVREHSHVDYCVSETETFELTVKKILEKEFTVKSLVTIRDPIDSYLSLMKNNWLHFTPKTFDEYCKRYLAFCSSFEPDQIVKYEDFVEKPDRIMESICSILCLPYSSSFLDTFSSIDITGDSGRTSEVIEVKPRREIDEELSRQINNSNNYDEFAYLYGYMK